MGGEGVDESGERDGIGRWVCEESGYGEVGGRVEVVGEAETREEEVDLGELVFG